VSGIWYVKYHSNNKELRGYVVPMLEGVMDMNATLTARRFGQRSLSARVWAFVSAQLMKIAELDARQGKIEPFGL
jgi:hypothetical protein